MKWIKFSDELICPSENHTFYVHVQYAGKEYFVTFARLEERNIMGEPIKQICSEFYKTEKEAHRRIEEIQEELSA
jgi:hypothetical protein